MSAREFDATRYRFDTDEDFEAGARSVRDYMLSSSAFVYVEAGRDGVGLFIILDAGRHPALASAIEAEGGKPNVEHSPEDGSRMCAVHESLCRTVISLPTVPSLRPLPLWERVFCAVLDTLTRTLDALTRWVQR